MRIRPVRPHPRRKGWAWSFAVLVVKPLLLATTLPRWSGGERIPASGGCLLVLNHVSHVDPLTAAHLVHDHGRLPRYLAKSDLFRSRFLRFFLTAAGQIPVERATRNAAGAYDAAVAAVRAGECVVVYPEGTITRDPDGWPMTGKTGAARIALATGCPVLPVGQWGAQRVLAPYARRPDLFPRKPVRMVVGERLDLADLLDRPQTPAVVAEATDRIMDAITALVAEIRGEQPPAGRWDPTRGTREPRPHPGEHQEDRP
jgi:1-acyl-sn-glycerol-3-phosphate acyltransferase